MKKYDKEYRADEGKIWVLTAYGKANCASYRNMEIGEEVMPGWPYMLCRQVDEGYVIEVDDPEYVELPGWEAVYDHKSGVRLSAGNHHVYHDKEMAECAAKAFNERPWKAKGDPEAYVIESVYKGKRPQPCRTYEGKPVYNQSYWTYDRPVGSLVEKEIVDDAINALPPACMRSNCMQMGEPNDERFDEEKGKWRSTYETFKQVASDIYEYCGDCFRGENVMRGKERSYVA